MSFWKHYPNRKDHRQPSKHHSNGCLDHGSCGWCKGNRMHSTQKRIESALERSIRNAWDIATGYGPLPEAD